ncbi:hypothetical protein NDU88_003127 [Pleurodeles waltl]|uniref:Uncharacterized protein n=1 Tax=Pleurodeles waltl TaxID=8319 RepID=A0AAV7WQK8_PLEWA|nr:hypothetical protein NDU88_003127 [Pleurodeles waltl]
MPAHTGPQSLYHGSPLGRRRPRAASVPAGGGFIGPPALPSLLAPLSGCSGPLRNTWSGLSEAPAGTDNHSVTAGPRQLPRLPPPGRALLHRRQERALPGPGFRPQLLHARCTSIMLRLPPKSHPPPGCSARLRPRPGEAGPHSSSSLRSTAISLIGAGGGPLLKRDAPLPEAAATSLAARPARLDLKVGRRCQPHAAESISGSATNTGPVMAPTLPH